MSYLIPSGAQVTVQTNAAAAGLASDSTTAPTVGIGAAGVIWPLAGTTVWITQKYQLSLTFTSGRWYTAAVGPATIIPADQ